VQFTCNLFTSFKRQLDLHVEHALALGPVQRGTSDDDV
jgi:hypothetical protein